MAGSEGFLIHPDDLADFEAVIRWWRTGRRPPRPPGTQQPGPRPNIRAILLEDLDSGGDAQAAVTRRQQVDEIQMISLSGTVSGGSFQLTFDGEQTEAIEHNATAADVQEALEALANINSGDVAVSGYELRWLVQFTGQFAGEDVPLMTAQNGLSGIGVAVLVTSAFSWVDADRTESIHGQIPVGIPTPLKAGAVISAGWFPEAASYGVLNAECRDLEY